MSVQRVRPEQLAEVLKQARRGQVVVIAAPPGAGKSTAMYSAILGRIAEYGPLPLTFQDVVWAVHGIKGPNSLGQEAFRKIQRLNSAPMYFMSTPFVAADVLWGAEEARARKVHYANQFRNPGRPPVHVTSQALALVLLTNQSMSLYQDFLRTVQYLVFDEDPTAALIYSLTDEEGSSPVSQTALEALKRTGEAGNIELALLQVMERAAAGQFKLKSISGGQGKPKLFSLTGRQFWTALTEELTGVVPDEKTFRASIQKLEQHAPASLFQVFEQELREARTGTNPSSRFGITWQVDAEGHLQNMAFRADVLREVPGDTPPIIVLDGYANSSVRQYELLFPNHDVNYVAEWDSSPLDIEYLPNHMNPSRNPDRPKQGIIDRQNLVTGDQRPWLHTWMAEIGLWTEGHAAGTLNLSYLDVAEYLKDRHDSNSDFRAQWSARTRATLPDDAMKFLWWFAGRGINDFEGCHVAAWHAPHRPSTYKHHVLAALAPTNAALRERLYAHYHQAELMQMLHRGRQPLYAEGDPERPRVITLFEPGPLPEAWAKLRPLASAPAFKKWSENPRHASAVRAIAGELLKLYNAVPHACLTALGLYKPKPTEHDLQKKVIGALNEKLRKASANKYPLLRAWRDQPTDEAKQAFLQKELGPFMAAHGRDTDRVLDILNAPSDPLKVVSHDIKLPPGVKGSTTRVYATRRADAEQALERLLK